MRMLQVVKAVVEGVEMMMMMIAVVKWCRMTDI